MLITNDGRQDDNLKERCVGSGFSNVSEGWKMGVFVFNFFGNWKVVW